MTETNAPGVFATLRATPASARYLLGGVLINQLGAFVQIFLVLYLVHEGLSSAKAGLALTVYSAGAVLGMLGGGELIARIGPRNTIALSMASSAVLVSLIPALSDQRGYPALLVLVAIAGALTQAYRPAAASLLSDLMPSDQRVMSFALLRIAMNIGAAAGPLLAAVLIEIDWDLLFWVDGFTALCYAILAVRLLPRDAAPAPASGGPAKAEPGAGRWGYAVLARDGRYLIYLLSMLLSAVIYVQFMVALPLKITAEGHPAALYSAVLALSSAILITCELAITARVQRWPAPLAAGLGTTIFALGLAGYGLAAGSAITVVLSTVVFVTGIMTSGPTKFAHPAKAPAEVKGQYIGASQAVFGIGLAIGPALGVAGWNSLGNGFWLLCGLIGVLSAVSAVIGMRARPGAALTTPTETAETAAPATPATSAPAPPARPSH